MFLKTLFPGRLSRLFGRLALLALLLVVMGAGAAVGVLIALVGEAEPLREFEDYSPDLISRVMDGDGEETVAEFSIERRDFITIDQVPQNLIHAFLAIEDERFFDHVGVSPHDVLVSAYANLRRGHIVRGFSTITMQLARKTIPQITDERTIQRKIREALAALRIEARYPKNQILEFYLNQIPMGNGIYGVQAAARNYFGVSVGDLTIAQCATIAGIASWPEIYNPRDALQNAERGRQRRATPPEDDATWRRNLVLSNMRHLGFITAEEYKAARAEPMELKSTPDRTNVAPYFVDLVRRQIIADPTLGSRALFHEGTTIHSTVDLPLQALAERTLTEGLASVELLWESKKPARFYQEDTDLGWRIQAGQRRLVRIAEVTPTGLILSFDDYVGDAPLPAEPPYFHPDQIIAEGKLIDVIVQDVNDVQRTFRARLADRTHVQGALVVLDNHTGHILALVGGSDWYDESNAGQWNRAIQGGRQPGSCFKPFVFACALEQGGMTPATMIVDERVEYPMGANLPPYVPRNYENRYYGPTTLVEALEHSRNVVTVKLTARLGVNNVRDFASRFDFTDDTLHWQIPSFINVGLGIHDVTPLELACAMATFANDGVIVRPVAWTEISDVHGEKVRAVRPPERRIIRSDTAAQVLYMLQQVVRGGTGKAEIGDYMLGQPGVPELAGKTGTTTNNIDAWFAGLTPDWSVVVFVGFDDNIDLGPEMTGGRVAGPIWRAFMEQALRLRPPAPDHMKFAEPPNLVHVDLCSQSGLLWSSACEEAQSLDTDEEVVRYRNVPFRPGTQPTSFCPFTSPYM